MLSVQTRRQLLTNLSAAGAASLLGSGRALATEPSPEVTTIRLRRDPGICIAPWYVAEDLLHAEGFTDVQYVQAIGLPAVEMLGRGELDFALWDAGSVVFRLDAGVPVTAIAGLHSGCFELFAHEPIRTISDLKGKRVGIDVLGSGKHRYVAVMAAQVGLDPNTEIEWVEGSDAKHLGLFPMELFVDRKVDAFLGFPPEPQELRARKIGHVILNTTTDMPWSQYFCCMVVGNREFARDHPVATKRILRALLKANDICAAEPARAARQLLDRGFVDRYDSAFQTLTEVPYASWRELDPADSLRFFGLRLHEIGMIKSSPNKIIAGGTDWRFLNEIKRELKGVSQRSPVPL
jgi:NitT/TauT family transport system substrate-binding protein